MNGPRDHMSSHNRSNARPRAESPANRELPSSVVNFANRFDKHFDALLSPPDDVPKRLADAARYSALAPGKRLRPYLLSLCCRVAGGSEDDIWSAAAAVECVHAFSLIHDDLPAMDDDDLRRGRPSCHKQFDEATAILAGDALLTLAFELLASDKIDARKSQRMVSELARGIGWSGMIGGQSADMDGEALAPTLSITQSIHERKTARFFECACRIGGIVGGGDEKAVDALGQYGLNFGLAFQIADDLLDVLAPQGSLGKRSGKDAIAGKQTFPRCVGIEESQSAACASADKAIAVLLCFGDSADDLRAMARYLIAQVA